VGKPAVLLASGLSGNYAVAVATNVPELCQRLLLLSPISLFEQSRPRPWLQALTRFSLPGMFIYALLTPRVILHRVIAWQYALDEKQLSDDDLNYSFAAAHQLGAQYAALAFINGELGLDVSLQLEYLQRPALMIWGVSALRRVQSIIPQYSVAPQIEMLSLPDSGRCVHEESPREAVAAILRWQDAPEKERAEAIAHAQTVHVEKGSASQTMLDPSSASASAENVQLETIQDNLRVEVTTSQPEESSESEGSGGPENAIDAAIIEAYCLKCKQKRTMQDARRIVTRNGRFAMEGTCPVCGTKLMRFVSA
jgi:hypothetical protein